MNLFKTPRYLHWMYPKRTWGFSMDKNAVYLTFDDGPNPILTPWILDFLREKNIKATFFCVGNNIEKYQALFAQILEEGHQVGNHTMRHEKQPKTDWKTYRKSISDTQNLVGNTLFRPPYGRLSMRHSVKLSKEFKIIMWSWLSYDFDSKVPIEKVLSKAKKQIQGGQILVFHDNDRFESRVKVLLPKVIEIIEEKKLQFKIISS